mmetsp:Transcript_63753/g.176834  ORF Transcript_63753/g.176834 Transcript_63753/m.176834 type:complete len:255 (+) Transcript_63753:833-1597(+)
MCFSHLCSSRYLKYSLSHFRGAVVQWPSKPAVNASLPFPVPQRPGHGVPWGLAPKASLGDGPAPAGQAPCAFPKAWPPPTSATVPRSSWPMRVKESRMSLALSAGSGLGFPPSSVTGPSGLTYTSPTVVGPRGRVHRPLTLHGNSFSCRELGPKGMLFVPSASSMRPKHICLMGVPMLRRAVVPAKMKRSPQLSASPYFLLSGATSALALSRLVLSGQLLSGSKRWRPPPHPPFPSVSLYEPAQCHAKRMKKGP